MPSLENSGASRQSSNAGLYGAARYRESHALLIEWDSNDAQANVETVALERVLREKYAVQTRLISASSNDPIRGTRTFQQAFIEQEVCEFVRLYSAPDILLLVFVSGTNSFGGLVWNILQEYSGFSTANSPTSMDQQRTSPMQSPIERNTSDMVIFFECCLPEMSAQHLESPNDSVVRIMAAGINQGTEIPNQKPFFTSIRRALQDMCCLPSFTISEIWAYLDHDSLANSPPVEVEVSNRESRSSITIIPFQIRPDDCTDTTTLKFLSWGPLGPLSPDWVMMVDNNDPLRRPYYTNQKSKFSYWTRPLTSVSAQQSPESNWNSHLFSMSITEALTQNPHLDDLAIRHKTATQEHGVEVCRTGIETFAEWHEGLAAEVRGLLAQRMLVTPGKKKNKKRGSLSQIRQRRRALPSQNPNHIPRPNHIRIPRSYPVCVKIEEV